MANGKPGAPKGNQNAKNGKGSLWADAIRKEVLRADDVAGVKKLRKLARKLVDSGLEGDLVALKEIGDRLDGKPAQTVQRTDNRTITMIQRVIVDQSKPPIEGQAVHVSEHSLTQDEDALD